MPQSKARTYAKVLVGALQGALEKEAKQKIQRFKRLLYKRGDFKHISKILPEFARAWKERKGKTASIVTAEPLAENTRKQIGLSLKKQGYVPEEKVDAEVIGGMALFLGNDYVIDGTIRGKLQRLTKVLN